MDVSEDAIQQETELDEVDIPIYPSRKPNAEQDGEDYLRKYVSQAEGYIGNLAMFLKRFC